MSPLERGIWHRAPEDSTPGDYFYTFFKWWKNELGQRTFRVTVRDYKGFSYVGDVDRVDSQYVELARPEAIGDMAVPLESITAVLVAPDDTG